MLLASTDARAWQEIHETGADVFVELGTDGVASIHDVLRWHVVRGPLHWIDLEGVDSAGMTDAGVTVTAEDGRTLGAHLDPRDEHAVRVTVDDPKAFQRGTFLFDVRWRADWVKAHAIARDGAAWRVAWTSPLASEGLDSVKTTFVFPPARQAPAAIFPDTGAVDDTALATFRREPSRDVLELVRPHVGRGESVAWTLRIDPSALPAVVDPHLRPAAPEAPPPEPDRVRAVCSFLALAALAVVFALLVGRKSAEVASVCAGRGARPRGLLPRLPERLRPALAGVLLAGGAALQSMDAFTPGACLVAAAALVAALRAPSSRWPVRGPGRWLALRPEDAFAQVPDDGNPPRLFDLGTHAGRLTAWATPVAVVLMVALARRFGTMASWLVALDSAVLVPLFLTGGVAGLPPRPSAAATWLAPVFDRLRAVASLRVAPWARVAADAAVDEVRLLVLPRASIPGLVGVEVGRAWSTTPAGWTGTPEVLVRVLEGSSAAAKLARELPKARMLPGRRGDERVLRVRPRTGTRASTVALTQGLAEALTDRRSPAPAAARDVAVRTEPRVDRRMPVRPASIAEPKAC